MLTGPGTCRTSLCSQNCLGSSSGLPVEGVMWGSLHSMAQRCHFNPRVTVLEETAGAGAIWSHGCLLFFVYPAGPKEGLPSAHFTSCRDSKAVLRAQHSQPACLRVKTSTLHTDPVKPHVHAYSFCWKWQEY